MLPGNPWLGVADAIRSIEAARFSHAVGWRGGCVAACSTRAADQAYLQSRTSRVRIASSSPYLLAAFQQGLGKLGYIEGENLFIERRYAEGLEERLPQLAGELVRFGVDVIFAIGPPQALAAARATSTIPIVFVGGGDPVAIGLVKSLAHPGGNVTGLTLVTVELAGKRIQLLKEVVPSASRVAILWNPNNSINKLELQRETLSSNHRLQRGAKRGPCHHAE